MPSATLSSLLREIDEALDRGLPDDVRPLAAFDADGTLWSGDVGETAFLRGFDDGVILPATVSGPLLAWAKRWALDLDDDPALAFARLGELCDGERILEVLPDGMGFDEARHDLYAMQAWIYAGRTREEVEAYGERLFRGGLEDTLHPFSAPLLEALCARGLDVIVVSGSHRDLVVPGVARLGLEPARVYGSLPDVDEAGRYLPTDGCALYGDAKERKVRAHLDDKHRGDEPGGEKGGVRPLLSFGDSVEATDRALLACAAMPVAVRPTGRHLEAARAKGMRILA